jgi:hypothetical protein
VLASLDWSTAATLATAVGTLVLAFATFAAVRSANRAARVAEAAYQANLRPVLVTSRLEDPVQKIRWVDEHWAHLAGAQAHVQMDDGNIYLAMSLRNMGNGIAVPIGWYVFPERVLLEPHVEPEQFRLQSRDMFIAGGDTGFWQAAVREASDPDYAGLRSDVLEAKQFTIDLLYGDHDGGQRTITRFGMIPLRIEGELRWYPSVGRHWSLDRPDPR